MKRLVLTAIVALVLVTLGAVACAGEETGPTPGGETASTCVSCHTDKALLKEVADPEEEEKSEATSGEG
ncbi:hypothetical protein ACFLWV_00095 [Chloroflexota bacterium]